MSAEILVAVMALAYALVLRWACRHLPREEWQILASLPVGKNANGQWRGVNITYYGLIIATSYAAAAALGLAMLGSVGVRPGQAMLVFLPLTVVCVPASRFVARMVEKKPATTTVAGAFFVGLIVAPWLTALAGRVLRDAPSGFQVLTVTAALAVAYALGEGLGRLACISFGCCYGRPLDDCPPLVRRLFAGHGFTFTGVNKKACYEGGLEGRPLLPIQAVTSAVSVGAALLGLYFFLHGWFAVSLWTVLAITQLWRALSEVFRRDFRGGGRLTAYQAMSLLAIVYGGLIPLIFSPVPTVWPAPGQGASALWNPAVLLSLQALWCAILIYLGRSKVTGSTIRFHLHQHQT